MSEYSIGGKSVFRKPGWCTVLRCMKILLVFGGNCKLPGNSEKSVTAWSLLSWAQREALALHLLSWGVPSLAFTDAETRQSWTVVSIKLKMNLNKKTNKLTTKTATINIPKMQKASLNPVIKSCCPVGGKGWSVTWDTIIPYLNGSIQRTISSEHFICIIFVNSFKYNRKTPTFWP